MYNYLIKKVELFLLSLSITKANFKASNILLKYIIYFKERSLTNNVELYLNLIPNLYNISLLFINI